MTSRAELRAARPSPLPFVLTKVSPPDPGLSRWLYATVGGPWTWYQRRPWTDAEWLAYLDRADLETWVAHVAGEVAGYAELERQASDVQIMYFGLVPRFVGQGLGGPLLAGAVERAWAMGARRVWVHTCDLDHPHAQANYEARGFRVYRTEQTVEDIP